MSKSAAKTVHTLKVTLRQVKPPVWRRIVVASDTKLPEFAANLEAAMGWDGGHLHGFETPDGVRYGDIDPDWQSGDLDERRFKVSSVLRTVGSKLRFDYDFGDGWGHDVVVEKIEPAERGVKYPVCIAGRQACPPEDCGGPWGYADLLEALADKQHERHEELTEWVGEYFDPDEFDVGTTTEAMQMSRPLQGW